jgi:hypothetical protein
MTETSRGKLIYSLSSDKIKDKHICHIGCGNGKITQEFSKHARKITAIEIEEDKAISAKQLNYSCDTEVIHGDAYDYLKNSSINPEMFYFWSGFRPKIGGMQWWLETVIRLFVESPPDVMFGISLSKHNGHYVDNIPLQLNSAKIIQKIYGGKILKGSYFGDNDSIIPFGLFTINLNNVKISGDMFVGKSWNISYKSVEEYIMASPTKDFEKYYIDRLGQKHEL